jgi:hypothetical protein
VFPVSPSFVSGRFAHLALAAIIDVTAARLALVVAMNKHAGHSRTTARAGVVGLRIFRWEIRHRQIIKEDNRSFSVFYANQKVTAYFRTTNPRNLVLFF